MDHRLLFYLSMCIDLISTVRLSGLFFSILNSMANPFVYTALMSSYRSVFIILFLKRILLIIRLLLKSRFSESVPKQSTKIGVIYKQFNSSI